VDQAAGFRCQGHLAQQLFGFFEIQATVGLGNNEIAGVNNTDVVRHALRLRAHELTPPSGRRADC
jgi:hypothetical protein